MSAFPAFANETQPLFCFIRSLCNNKKAIIRVPVYLDKITLTFIYRTVYNGSMIKTDVKQKILEVGLNLFSEKGYEGVSVSDLTEASGITKPTLYYYFGSKEGVYEAISQINYNRLNTAVLASSAYSPNPKSYYDDIFAALKNLTAAYFSFVKENEPFYRMALANLFMPRSSAVWGIVAKCHKEQYEIINKMFSEMASVHKNLKDKNRILTWSFVGLINAYVGLYFNDVPDVRLNEQNIKDLVRQFMHGIYS